MRFNFLKFCRLVLKDAREVKTTSSNTCAIASDNSTLSEIIPLISEREKEVRIKCNLSQLTQLPHVQTALTNG